MSAQKPRPPEMNAHERRAVALAHSLFEVRAYLLVRCAGDPQAERLARVAEHAADLLCPRDPKGTV